MACVILYIVPGLVLCLCEEKKAPDDWPAFYFLSASRSAPDWFKNRTVRERVADLTKIVWPKKTHIHTYTPVVGTYT